MSHFNVNMGLEVARSQGLVAEFGRCLSDSSRTVILIEPCGVVAKVGPSTDENRFRKEVELAAYIAHKGGPVVRPCSSADPGPHVHGHRVVSLWEFAPADADSSGIEEAAPAAYKELRRYLRGYPGALPSYLEPIEACRGVLESGLLHGLSKIEQRLVRRPLESLSSLTVDRDDVRPLHGDTHGRNLTRTLGRALWLDLKSACLGPLEWDLAGLPQLGILRIPNPDRFRRLQKIQSACVVIWCLMKPKPNQHEQEAIAFHLQKLADAPAT